MSCPLCRQTHAAEERGFRVKMTLFPHSLTEGHWTLILYITHLGLVLFLDVKLQFRSRQNDQPALLLRLCHLLLCCIGTELCRIDFGLDVTVAFVHWYPLLLFQSTIGRICFLFFFWNLGQRSKLLVVINGPAFPSPPIRSYANSPPDTEMADTDSGGCPVGFPECVLTWVIDVRQARGLRRWGCEIDELHLALYSLNAHFKHCALK